jgi:hypothetical protein
MPKCLCCKTCNLHCKAIFDTRDLPANVIKLRNNSKMILDYKPRKIDNFIFINTKSDPSDSEQAKQIKNRYPSLQVRTGEAIYNQKSLNVMILNTIPHALA